MPAPQKIHELVEQFKRNRDDYRAVTYNETQTRREFIDPFFEAMGWDVGNKQGYAEAYKEVIHETAVKVKGKTKAPDYAFRIGGTAKFFVEAKKPSINIKDDIHPAYQLRSYAWSGKLPLSILTDFEEFAVYDCRPRPVKSDKAANSRVMYFTYDQYIEKWDEITAIFSPEAIRRGSFDRYVQSNKVKRGTAEVDDAFLADISSWRELLARNIALRNTLKQRELNFAVQRIIDRIIFLRIAEDRGIEPYGRLRDAAQVSPVYGELCRLFQLADQKYNSGLFHFKPEKGREGEDGWTLDLTIDDKPLRTILKNLYYPDSPFQFDMIPADILGQVYEQFLGKVIRLTASGQAKIEDKPEVKKAGGVFYTPTYIVNYIVEQTVGKLLAGRKPGPKGDATKLRILDPACGSGSFLIGAYQYLLDWHLEQYKQKPEKWTKGKAPAIFDNGSGWRLTIDERKRILLNNIYGVDIDPQAVEVTKLSLLLKVLEGETEAVQQQKLLADRVLPDLDSNIKCGNSLIGPDFYDGQQLSLGLLDEEEMYRINVFDWEAAFRTIVPWGGFDAVIGNPPYVRQEMLNETKPYLQKQYKVYHGSADLYAYFIEKGLNLLKKGGYFSYIVANKWLRAGYGDPLRKWLKKWRFVEITDFGDLRVFENATAYPCILIFQNDDPKQTFSATNVKHLEFFDLSAYIQANQHQVKLDELNDEGWSLVNEETKNLLNKLEAQGIPFSEYITGEIFRGVVSGRDGVFVIDEATRDGLIAKDPNSAEIIKPYLAGRDVQRYEIKNTNRFLIFSRRGIDIDKYPAVKEYLKQFRDEITPKPKNWRGGKWSGRKSGSYEWYEIQDAMDYYHIFEEPKLIYLKFQVRPAFTIDYSGFYPNSAIWIIPGDDKLLLGILNSKMGWFLISQYCTQIQNGYQLIYKYMQYVPICKVDSRKSYVKDKVVSLVEQLLQLETRLTATRLPQEKTMLQRQITATDAQIDQLVYQLYDLTPEEIAIVEGA